MGKFFGIVGYVESKETAVGVWSDVITERTYYGDVIRNTRRLESGEQLNDNVNVNNLISIVADGFANENFFAIRYIRWMGVAWKVSNVDVQRPRLVLTLGGVYNGQQA